MDNLYLLFFNYFSLNTLISCDSISDESLIRFATALILELSPATTSTSPSSSNISGSGDNTLFPRFINTIDRLLRNNRERLIEIKKNQLAFRDLEAAKKIVDEFEKLLKKR